MRRYKGKHNDELFSLIDDIDESLGENNSFNSYHNPSALTPEEVLAQNAASEADNEPTGALDYNTGKAILKLLHDTCRSTGTTVIIITHNQAICSMADRVIKIKNGKVTENTVNAEPLPAERIEW